LPFDLLELQFKPQVSLAVTHLGSGHVDTDIFREMSPIEPGFDFHLPQLLAGFIGDRLIEEAA